MQVFDPLDWAPFFQLASPMTFHGPGDRRAVQAVKVTAMRDGEEKERVLTYTFCLQKVTISFCIFLAH